MQNDLRARFDEDGYVRLDAAVDPAAVAAMADAVWAELSRRHGIRRDDRSTWPIGAVRGLGVLRKGRAFDALGSAAVRAAITELTGDADAAPWDWGGPLVSFPEADGRWSVPAAGWHLDWPARGAPATSCSYTPTCSTRPHPTRVWRPASW